LDKKISHISHQIVLNLTRHLCFVARYDIKIFGVTDVLQQVFFRFKQWLNHKKTRILWM